MNGISEWFVAILLLPVTVFILIPLSMLVVWTLVNLLGLIAGFSLKKVFLAENQVQKPSESFK